MSHYLRGKKILLCVSSGIAIYKTVDLASRLRKAGCILSVILTPQAREMVSDVVFSSVGGCAVYLDINDVKGGWIPHTELSRWADVVILAPATANTMAKIAAGIADNLLLATVLAATGKPKLLVPTMNSRMYENPATTRNIVQLRDYGWHIIDPETGELACGEFGLGRYPDNEVIVSETEFILAEKRLSGKKVLVTAGPTRERIDRVRFITNRSSGKMGYAVARAARNLGATVVLVTGPTTLKPLHGIETVEVESAAEMKNVVAGRFSETDILIMAAAVADYSPENPSSAKIKKTGGPIELVLLRTSDILQELQGKEKRLVVGFCAEDQDLIENCRDKLIRKELDMIVANDISSEDSGFESDYNDVWLLFKDGRKIHVPRLAKDEVAYRVVCEVANLQKS
ncbi:MAG TPA: bifunctional phosphopantothenoylcysteine decarboxylase/phosphopantothenate--cysteine ligase CoaBC [Kosmotogaceae bacterium]|nr:MAG: Phosphopantothenoylcysteine decarboxylase/phosphopantothenate/cysteine ligase [Thermotogales bacterium 46_20]HAA85082.1 bifunctional phosphopantothenoylcysteine decarboxylase/phosphopantothenate--cysteine ligase CoaBC [Kosmotogaceae bacterium]